MHGNAVVTFYAPTNAVCQICIYIIFKVYINIIYIYHISYIYIIIIIFIHPGTSRIRSHMTPYIPLNIHQPQPFLFVFAGPWSLDHCNPGTRQSWAEQAGRSARGNPKHQGETRPATAQMGTLESMYTSWSLRLFWWILGSTVFNFACISRDVPFWGLHDLQPRFVWLRCSDLYWGTHLNNSHPKHQYFSFVLIGFNRDCCN